MLGSGASEATTKKSPENPRTAVDDLRERIEMSNFAKSSVSSMSSTSMTIFVVCPRSLRYTE